MGSIPIARSSGSRWHPTGCARVVDGRVYGTLCCFSFEVRADGGPEPFAQLRAAAAALAHRLQ